MKIAVTYENEQIYQHFGHAARFKLYDVEGSTVVSTQVVGTDGIGHGALAGLLKQWKVDTLICGGIGGGARMALAEAGVQVYGGVSGDADEAVEAFLCGSLCYDPNARCNHHDHGNGHSCGSHSCGH